MIPNTQEYIEASLSSNQEEFQKSVKSLSPENRKKMEIYEKAFNDLKESGLSFQIFYHIPGTNRGGGSHYYEPDFEDDRPTKKMDARFQNLKIMVNHMVLKESIESVIRFKQVSCDNLTEEDKAQIASEAMDRIGAYYNAFFESDFQNNKC